MKGDSAVKHYEFFKLTPDADVIDVQQKIRRACDRLDAELDWLNHTVVYRNCGDNTDADIMAVVEVDAEEKLPEYLEAPRYRELLESLKGQIVCRRTFDHY